LKCLARRSENGDFNNIGFQDSGVNGETSLTSTQEQARRSRSPEPNQTGIDAELVKLTILLKPFSARIVEPSFRKKEFASALSKLASRDFSASTGQHSARLN
jgi:hypothetical protein